MSVQATSSTTRMSSTVSSSSVIGTLSSARYSPRKRPISFTSHHDRVRGIHHHSSGRSRSRSRSRSPHPLNTNFRIPLLSRENERKDKRRYKDSNDRHPAKYPRPHLASFARRCLGEHNSGFIRDYRSSPSDEQEMRHDYRRTNISLDVSSCSRRGRRL